MVADLAIFSACFKLYLTGQCVRTIKNTCPPLLILTDELIGKTACKRREHKRWSKAKYTKPAPYGSANRLMKRRSAIGECMRSRMFALHGSEIDLSQDGTKSFGAEMPSVFKNNARGLCDAG